MSKMKELKKNTGNQLKLNTIIIFIISNELSLGDFQTLNFCSHLKEFSFESRSILH